MFPGMCGYNMQKEAGDYSWPVDADADINETTGFTSLALKGRDILDM